MKSNFFTKIAIFLRKIYDFTLNLIDPKRYSNLIRRLKCKLCCIYTQAVWLFQRYETEVDQTPNPNNNKNNHPTKNLHKFSSYPKTKM